MIEQSSFLALIGRAAVLTAARWPLYALAAAATVALEGALVALRLPNAVNIGGAIFPAILTTLVYSYVDADTKAEPPPVAAVWERILERSWAVIVIDFFESLAFLGGNGSADPGAVTAAVIITVVLLVNILLVFADASAAVDDDVPWWWLVPAAFARSLRAVWHGPTFIRAVVLVAISLMIAQVGQTLSAGLADALVPNADFWGFAPIQAILTPPFAALTLLVYRDVTAPKEAS